MSMPRSSELASHWQLEPEIVFLNHGSFGACPRAILEQQRVFRDELEREPVRFFERQYGDSMMAAREALGAFLGAPAGDLAFVANATGGVNTVLRSIDWQPGDELLVTNHEYNACRNAIDFVAQRAGARVVVVAVPFPIEGPEQVVEAVVRAVTGRTRLALIDYITSPTGLVFPVEAIVAALAERGVDTLIDGAHAPGMVPVNLERVGAAYFTGNCHKWLCTPKGSAVLYVRPDRQGRVRPLTISHGANAPLDGTTRYRVEFDWTGTIDPTPFMVIPHTIAFLGGLVEGGWPALYARNRDLALKARDVLTDCLGVRAPAPDGMLATLAAIELPDVPLDEPIPAFGWDPLQRALYDSFGIQVPVLPFGGPRGRLIRVSAQLYNHLDQYRYLAGILARLLS